MILNDPQTSSIKSESWQQQTLERVLLATIKEQRAKRRWGIFFKLIILGYFVGLFIFFMPSSASKNLGSATEHTALIKLNDEISADSLSGAAAIIPSLNAAFKNPHSKAIILELNSPGGSPVQSGEIYDEILRLRRLYPNKPIYSVITDTCASGCYYIAVAADEIYANEASLVGSIGVLFNGFGFVDLAQKVGVQRRLITAGTNKGFLDPFLPINPEQEAFMHTLLEVVHKQFIDKVKARRSDKLAKDDKLFTGLIWTGEQAIPLGLIDKLGNTRMVARDVIGQENIVDYSEQESFFQALSSRMGVTFDKSFQSLMAPQMSLQ
jgi:protease-4